MLTQDQQALVQFLMGDQTPAPVDPPSPAPAAGNAVADLIGGGVAAIGTLAQGAVGAVNAGLAACRTMHPTDG